MRLGRGALLGLLLLGAGDAGERFEGIVVDAYGHPIAGATIAGQGWELRVDAGGRFELDLPRGQRQLRVHSPGYATTETFGDAPEGGRIVLDREAQIAGQLIDGLSRAPIGAARLLLLGSTLRQARTDAAGRFLFSGLPAGSYRLRAWAPGRSARSAETIEVEAGDEVKLLLEGWPAFTVAGDVSVESTGQACAKPYVVMRGALDVEEARGDEDGHVVFPAVSAGSYAVEVSCKDQGGLYLPRLDVGAEGPSPHRWVIPRGRQLRGQVLGRAGRPRAGTPVFGEALGRTGFRGGMTLTDDQGRFVLRGLGVGSIEVSAELEDVSTSTLVAGGARDVDGVVLRPPQVERSMESAPTRLEGVLASADGRPLYSTELVVSSSGSAPISVLTDPAGSFSLLVQPGPVEVALSSRVPLRLSSGARALETWAQAGTVTQLYLEAVRGGQRIHGRALGTDGAPLVDALVVAVLEREGTVFSGLREGWAHAAARTQTDRAGAFVLSGLAEGAYRLRAFGGRGARGPAVAHEVSAPGTALLVATPQGTLRGQVLGLDTVAPQFRLRATSEDLEWTKEIESTDASGNFIVRGVPAGPIALTVRSRSGGGHEVHDLRPQAADAVELHLSPLGPLLVRVHDEDGHPRPSCLLTLEGELNVRLGKTDVRGELLFEGIGPGPHQVEVSCVGDVPAPVELCVDNASIDLPTTGRYEPVTIRLPSRRPLPEDLLARVGLSLRGNKVRAVRAGGPAMKAGLRAGDVLAQVDGYDVIARPRLIGCLLAPGVPLVLQRGLRTTLPAAQPALQEAVGHERR